MLEVGGTTGGRLMLTPAAVQGVSVEQHLRSTSPTEVSWTWSAQGDNPAFTQPLGFSLALEQPQDWQVWAPWGDPRHKEVGQIDNLAIIANACGPADYKMNWADPLKPIAFESALFHYGAPPFELDAPRMGFCPFTGDLLCIPMVSLLHRQHDVGISWILSPDDTLLDLNLEIEACGRIHFSHLHQRLGAGRKLVFNMHLVVHEAGWRGGLRWIAQRFRQYFEPPAGQLAQNLAGTGAYSHAPVPEPGYADHLRQMAFRTNWRASFDFPLMGLFIPTCDRDQAWPMLHRDHAGMPLPGNRPLTTVGDMSEYARQMKKVGFEVLHYFNVTEFGTDVRYPPKPVVDGDPDRFWKDGDALLWSKFAEAVVRVPPGMKLDSPGVIAPAGQGGPFYTWGGAVAVDCGVPSLHEHFLEQAERHFKLLPDGAGLCIDRLDWTRLYIEGDDSVSFLAPGVERSLLSSYRRFMDDLRQLADQYRKVIFVNNHTKRLDQLRHVDGMFDEFTYSGPALNTSALLGIFKPVLGWTAAAGNLHSPTPDVFFQRYLYLGVFPMCPAEGNDHSIGPDPGAERWYTDYGPLLASLRGKRWVLDENCVSVDLPEARVNLFERPGQGWVVPIMLADEQLKAKVEVRGQAASASAAQVLHPGSSITTSVAIDRLDAHTIAIDVPLMRGAAMLLLKETDEGPKS